MLGGATFPPKWVPFFVKFRPKVSNFNAWKWPSTILGCNFRSRTSFQILICGIDAELNSESIPHTLRPQNRRRKSIFDHFCFRNKDFSWAFWHSVGQVLLAAVGFAHGCLAGAPWCQIKMVAKVHQSDMWSGKWHPPPLPHQNPTYLPRLAFSRGCWPRTTIKHHRKRLS